MAGAAARTTSSLTTRSRTSPPPAQHRSPQHNPERSPPAPPPRDTPQSRKLEQQIAGLKNQLKDIQARLARGGTPAEQSSLIHQQEALDLQIKQLEADAAHSRQNAASAPAQATATEPDISKEAGMTATLAPDAEIVYTSFPIEKMEQEGDTLYVYGKATTPEVDSDEQVVDKDWSGEALKSWFATGPNVRVQHNPQRDPAGSGVKVEIDRDGDGAHWVKAAIDEPNAQLLVRKGHLRAFSVGIAKPLIVRDTTGKARNGIIKGGELAEISLVDRPANRSCYMEIAKAAKDGSCELVGKVHGADLLTKADHDDTVNVDIPKSASDHLLAQATWRNCSKHRSVAEDREADTFKAMTAAEEAVLKRNIDTATRRRLASEGKALPNLSYPIENAEDLGNAATLARSGHGDVGAARKLIARRAKELGVANPLDEDDAKKADDVEAAKSVPAEVAAPAAVAKDGAPQLHHNDGDDDDTDSDADAMDKAATPAPAPEKAAAPDMAKKPKMPCPKCKGMNKPKAKFCGKCGAPMMAAKSATPGDGVTGEHTEAAPAHREPDGPAIEALEHDAGMPTVPDSSVKNDDAEVLAVAARHKALGVDSEMGMLHDLTCAAYDPAAGRQELPRCGLLRDQRSVVARQNPLSRDDGGTGAGTGSGQTRGDRRHPEGRRPGPRRRAAA